jgi:hypothetical protein
MRVSKETLLMSKNGGEFIQAGLEAKEDSITFKEAQEAMAWESTPVTPVWP